jgi:hypothetical protein
VDALAFAQVEHFGSVVAKRTDEKSSAGGVEIEVIYPSFYSGEHDRLLQLKRRITGFTGGEIIANHCDDEGKS